MGLVVDFIIILIFAACVFNGYKKGLAKCLLKLLTSVLAIIVAIVLYKPIMNFVVDNTTIDDNIELSIEKTINQNKDENNSEIINEDSGLPDPVVKYVNTNLKESVDTQKDKAVKEVSSNAAKLIVAVGCIIIVYIISKILLRLATIILDVFAKLPVLKQFNELGGIIYGILEGLVVILIILTLISVITPLIGNYTISNLIEQSYIGKMLYNTNIFLNLIF